MFGTRAPARASKTSLIYAVAFGAGLFCTSGAQAQIDARVEDPPLLVPLEEAARESVPGAAATDSRTKTFDLSIVYRAGRIWNPATAGFDNVNLRSYEGTGVNPKGPYVSPTIAAAPGDTVRVKLRNKLPSDMTCHSDGANVNSPHCFNSTNLHTHGLWVNPSGNGDNVLLSINPGVEFEYEYNIPDGHPAGTFWYHTHRHGSTALQVSSGMAGALIITGDRVPDGKNPGDLDVLLRGAEDRTLVLQQIQYACRDDNGNIKRVDPKNPNSAYKCDSKDVGAIESYDLFSPGEWPNSGRHTSINGLIVPHFQAEQGKLERWRLIHAGVRDTISLQFAKYEGRPLRTDQKLAPAQMNALVDGGCNDTPLDYHIAAADGITMYRAAATDVATLQPGYRYDALIAFPEAGSYCVIDASAPDGGSVGGIGSSTRLLGIVHVAAGSAPPSGGLGPILRQMAQRNLPGLPAVADQVAALDLSSFAPHPPVAAEEVTGTQELTFLIDVSGANATFNVGSQDYAPRPYSPDRVDRKLTLGGVDEWTLRSEFVSHPFHIHVNPFQIISIKDPNGKEVGGPDGNDTYGSADGKPDPQYRGLNGVWKDTLMVKNPNASYPLPVTGTNPQVPPVYTIKVRTRYQRYIGEFVLHCHILDHEDQGMMQNVAIVLPGGSPASVNAASAGHVH